MPAAASAVSLQIITLPYASQALPTTPPLVTTALAMPETHIPGTVSSSERIETTLTPDGRPVGIVVVQRLRLRGLGDFFFGIPAPARTVAPAAGSESPPGLRPGQILWQGFSPRHKLLAVRATLERTAASTLPVRVSVRTSAGGQPVEPGGRLDGSLSTVLTVRNITGVQVKAFTANAYRLQAAAALDALRRTRPTRPVVQSNVTIFGRPTPTTVLMEALLHVEGTLSFPPGTVTGLAASGPGASVRGSTVRFQALIGAGRPATLAVRVRGVASSARAPALRLAVTPVSVDPALRPPARSWVEAVRKRRLELSGRELLGRALTGYLRTLRARQYSTFLANPDPAGANQAVYLFRPSPAAAVLALRSDSDGNGGVLVPIVAALGGMLALGALVVAWAHL